MLEMPGQWDVSWGKHGIQTLKLCVFQEEGKAVGRGCLSPLKLRSFHHEPCVSDLELQDLLFASLGFGLWSFLCYALFPPLVMGIISLCYYMFELSIFFILPGLLVKILLGFQKRLCTFEVLEPLRLWGLLRLNWMYFALWACGDEGKKSWL